MSEKFWDTFATRYSKQPIANTDAYARKIEITRQYFNPEMTVMEIGCGTGTTAIAQAPFVKKVQAIDISSKMIEIAQNKASSKKIDNIEFSKSSIDELSINDHSYCAVMGHSILHLVKDKDAVINKVYKMLKPGGIFVSSTTCMGDSFLLKAVSTLISVGSFLGLLPALNAFSSKELITSLSNAGFDIDYQWQPHGRSAIFIVAKKLALNSTPS